MHDNEFDDFGPPERSFDLAFYKRTRLILELDKMTGYSLVTGGTVQANIWRSRNQDK
jgi:hypothetical protein